MALDPQVVALAKAIRDTETGNRPVSGASGEFGRYQFMPGTWHAGASQYLGDANAPQTLENENKVAYEKIKHWKDQGYNPGQIASLWNSGSPNFEGKVGVNKMGVKYDVPGYVQKVYGNYQKYKPQTPPEAPTSPVEASKPGYSPLIPAKAGEGAVAAGAKTLANLPGSALNFAKGAIGQLNPLNIAKNVSEFATGLGDFAKEKGGVLPALGAVAKEVPGAAYKTLVPQAAQELVKGDTIAAQKTLTEDPFGQVAPFVLSAEAVGKGFGKAPAVDSAISKTGKLVTEPLGKVGTGIKKGVGASVEYGVSQATGLSPETIRTIIEDPKAFQAADVAGDSRLTTASKVKASLEAAIDDLSETGKYYDAVRSAKQPVKLPPNIVTDVLTKYGLQLGKDGKIVATAESVPLSPGDVSAIQQFVDQYGPSKVKTSNAFLNARKALDNLSAWDATKTDISDRIARDIRQAYDAQGKAQIKGLAETDAEYAPQVKELRQLKKDYLNADGTLKDGAINKIANLLGKGKEPILARLEAISPGITQDIKIIKALEDVESAQGQKVGTYLRGASGIAGGFAAGGPIGALIGAILTSPRIAVYFLEQYGKASGVGDLMIKRIKTKFENGTKLNTMENRAFLTILGVAANAQGQKPSQPTP